MKTVLLAILVLSVVALLFGLLLAAASRIFAVRTDPRLAEIEACLVGANCGGCGYPGCANCAAAILSGEAPVNACSAAGNEGAAKIARILGKEAPEQEPMVAHVICNGGTAAQDRYASYVGLRDCAAAAKIAGGPKECAYGCLGFGNCVEACRFDAIRLNDRGVAVVDREKCTDCGACRAACPRHLIVRVPKAQKVFVNCANPEKGAAAMRVCENSCIGCGLCQKYCPAEAIRVENGLAVIDAAKCRGCGLCAKACPHGAIEPVPTAEERERFREAMQKAAQKKKDT